MMDVIATILFNKSELIPIADDVLESQKTAEHGVGIVVWSATPI